MLRLYYIIDFKEIKELLVHYDPRHAALVQTFTGYLSMEIGKRKDLVPSCGLLNRLCSILLDLEQL